MQLINFSTGIMSLPLSPGSSDSYRNYSYSKPTFAYFVEKLVLQMKNGLSSLRYRPAEHKRLQAVIDAERLECDLIGQKVCFVAIHALKQQSWCTFLFHLVKHFNYCRAKQTFLNIDSSPCGLENCLMSCIGWVRENIYYRERWWVSFHTFSFNW